MKAITEITLDLTSPNYGAWVDAIQNDGNTRTVRAELRDDGGSWQIPADAEISVAYRKPDGTKGWYDQLPDGAPAVTAGRHHVTFVLASQMLSTPGTIRAGILFHDKSLNQLTTFPFTVSVEANPFSGGTESQDYIRLTWLQEKLSEYLEIAKASGEFDGKDGETPQLLADTVSYQTGLSGTVPPDGPWQDSIPEVPKGSYLWTRRIKQWSGADPVTDYSVSYIGVDGTGAVSSVCGIFPDSSGNIPLTPHDISALGTSGGTMTGPIHMNGQTMDGLTDPEQDDEAARKAYVDKSVKAAAPINLLDNSDFTNPVNQRGQTSYSGSGYTIDRWTLTNAYSSLEIVAGGVKLACDSMGTAAYPRQFVPGNSLKGKTVTVAICLEDGTIYSCYGAIPEAWPSSQQSIAIAEMDTGNLTLAVSNDGTVFIQIKVNAGKSIIVRWAAMYVGTFTPDTIPAYRPKGYGAELAECQRYYLVCNNFPRIRGSFISSSRIDFVIPIPVSMRIKPSIAESDFVVSEINGIQQSGFTFSVFNNFQNAIAISATKTSHGLSDALLTSSGGVWAFNADL